MEKTPKSLLTAALVGLSLAGCASGEKKPSGGLNAYCGPEALELAKKDYRENGNIYASGLAVDSNVLFKGESSMVRAWNKDKTSALNDYAPINPAVLRCGKEVTGFAGIIDEDTLVGVPADDAELRVGGSDMGMVIDVNDPRLNMTASEKLNYRNNCPSFDSDIKAGRLEENDGSAKLTVPKDQGVSMVDCAPSALVNESEQQFGIVP